MQSGRPLLVIVSGVPASGKTTLARRLAADGDLTLLSKDAIKEALADALGHPQSVVASSTLGVGAYAALSAMASRLLESSVGVVLESNFRRGTIQDELTRLAPGADAWAVHCALGRRPSETGTGVARPSVTRLILMQPAARM
ncbi:MAG: AAA family ATPase [Candidatus Limnocylindria bacterium]